ncbi:MAG: hypothetical protein Ta2E_08600 [Mycoplasmoidaceae bacterium]|nr:MAG: hypothetical protein Ta2E_08600 [Mycoplasmoidaceae bacterium]
MVSVVSIFAVYGLTKFIEWIAYDKAGSIIFSFVSGGILIRDIRNSLKKQFSKATWTNKCDKFANMSKISFGVLSIVIVATKLIIQWTWGEFIANQLKGLKI